MFPTQCIYIIALKIFSGSASQVIIIYVWAWENMTFGEKKSLNLAVTAFFIAQLQ